MNYYTYSLISKNGSRLTNYAYMRCVFTPVISHCLMRLRSTINKERWSGHLFRWHDPIESRLLCRPTSRTAGNEDDWREKRNDQRKSHAHLLSHLQPRGKLYIDRRERKMSKAKEAEGTIVLRWSFQKTFIAYFPRFAAPGKILKYLKDQNRPHSAGALTT